MCALKLYRPNALWALGTFLLAAPAQARAQAPESGAIVAVSSDSADRLRLATLEKTGGRPFQMLRSTSGLNADPRAGKSGFTFTLRAPSVWIATNSDLPSGENNGGLWAGRGPNARAIAGVDAAIRSVRITLLPEFFYSSNESFEYGQLFLPALPASRNPYSSPWNVYPYSIDAPVRMGPEKTIRIAPGQSSVSIAARGLEAGVTTENEWWGPGIRTGIVLSDNAEGFPRAFIRTPAPRQTRYGAFDFRLTWGGLAESEFFDTSKSNDLRYWSAFAATWASTYEPDLTIGVARAVYATAANWGSVAIRPLHVFLPGGHPNARPLSDSAFIAERDQIFSLFARWAFPGHGFEVFGELARTEFPTSFRDLLVQPGHSQGYTFGAQWVGKPTVVGKWRIQAEHSYLEQGPSFRNRPLGSFYTSRSVLQGYTNRGQVIGAGMGQGSSGDWLAIDAIGARYSLGAVVARTRFNNDAYFRLPFPYNAGHCQHDVTMSPGIRGSANLRWANLSAAYSSAQRMNAFFQNQTGCQLANPKIDVRNHTLQLSASFGL